MSHSYIPKPTALYSTHEGDLQKLGRTYPEWGAIRRELVRNGARVIGTRKTGLHYREAKWRGIIMGFTIHRFAPSCGGTCWRVIELELMRDRNDKGTGDLTAALDITGWEWVNEHDEEAIDKLFPKWEVKPRAQKSV